MWRAAIVLTAVLMWIGAESAEAQRVYLPVAVRDATPTPSPTATPAQVYLAERREVPFQGGSWLSAYYVNGGSTTIYSPYVVVRYFSPDGVEVFSHQGETRLDMLLPGERSSVFTHPPPGTSVPVGWARREITLWRYAAPTVPGRRYRHGFQLRNVTLSVDRTFNSATVRGELLWTGATYYGYSYLDIGIVSRSTGTLETGVRAYVAGATGREFVVQYAWRPFRYEFFDAGDLSPDLYMPRVFAEGYCDAGVGTCP